MTRRLGPPLAGLASVGAFMVLLSGAEAGAAGALAGVLLLAGVGWLVAGWLKRRRPAVADGWKSTAAVCHRAAAGHEPSAPGAVARALSRVEARELGFSATFGVGLGFCLMVLILFGQVWGSDFDGEPLSIAELFPIYVHPFAGLVVLATHRARTRSTREGTQELFETCPTSEATRTTGQLLTAWLPALTAIVFLLLLGALLTSHLTVVYGAVGLRQLALLLGAALLCAGATALGVALARWAPWTPVPVAAVILIGVASIRLATAGDRTTEPIRQLSTWLNDPELELRFTAPHWAAHHVWILALTGLVAVLALARDVRRPWVPVALVGFAAVAAVSAVAATRPITEADAERIAALIDDPAAHQRCVESSEVAVCTYASASALATHLADEIRPVVELAPRGTLSGWTIRQGMDVAHGQLDPAVRQRLDPRPPGERVIPVPVGGHPSTSEAARFWVALTAVGVTEPGGPAAVTHLQGQARGVIALWLAAQGADPDEAAAMTSYYPGAGQYDPGYSRPWPDICYAGPAPVVWAVSDLAAARELLAEPDEEVAALVESDWAHLTDPDTTTAELLRAAGLDPVAEHSGHTRSGDRC